MTTTSLVSPRLPGTVPVAMSDLNDLTDAYPNEDLQRTPHHHSDAQDYPVY